MIEMWDDKTLEQKASDFESRAREIRVELLRRKEKRIGSGWYCGVCSDKAGESRYHEARPCLQTTADKTASDKGQG